MNLHLSDFKANIIPSLVYIWFLVITIPTGRLMNRIGRKNTVILSLSLIAFSMLFPLFSERYDIMIICFILLGISSVALQTSLYPLVNNVVRDENLSCNLLFGRL